MQVSSERFIATWWFEMTRGYSSTYMPTEAITESKHGAALLTRCVLLALMDTSVMLRRVRLLPKFLVTIRAPKWTKLIVNLERDLANRPGMTKVGARELLAERAGKGNRGIEQNDTNRALVLLQVRPCVKGEIASLLNSDQRQQGTQDWAS